ncbi:MAG: peptidoglycan-binding protein, partial [Clostridia bacterium]|nr:peptidoglycan-binding protein [Clostridia bacterium]
MSAMDSKEAKSYTLKLGMKGSEVKAVQKRLKALGYLTSNAQVNGYYGEATEDAVEEFQRRNGLSADGTVGPKTLEKLNSSSARKAAVKATPKPTAKPKTTKKPTKTSKTSKVTPKPGKKATTKPKTTTKAPSKATPKPANTSNKRGVEKLIAIAESRIGCPYSGGAKGPNKFDCSGFVYWCMKQAGFSGGYLTSRAWRSTGRYKRITNIGSIQRGDILVFKGNSMATGHVGIYLGGGKMIDASSGAGQVRVTSSVLSGNYWKQHFLMAYRIYD